MASTARSVAILRGQLDDEAPLIERIPAWITVIAGPVFRSRKVFGSLPAK